MAKVAYTKLGLTKNQEVKSFIWNDQIIEVKQYLPVNDMIELVSNVINLSHDEQGSFSNPIRTNIYTTLEILFKYTNINFTDKQKEDVFKLYDLVVGSEFYDKVIELIPKEEYARLIKTINDAITAIYAYQNSVMGILETISTDYSNLDLDATNISAKLADPENMSFLKSILTNFN